MGTNKKLSQVMKVRLLKCYIEPILMYSCETWTLTNKIRKQLEATEMWFLRRMMRIPLTDRKTNNEVLEMAEYTRAILSKIKKRKAKFMGHVMRRNGLENLITTGKFEGKRGRGRQRQK